jgi:hypothetical protein
MDRLRVGRDELVELIARAKALLDETGLLPEVEIRFGAAGGAGFVPGMTPEDLLRVEKLLDAWPDWNRIEEWMRIHSFTHGSNIPGDTRELRTEHSAWSEVHTSIETVHKESKGKLTYRTVEATGAPTDFRVALALERPVDARQRPPSAEPTRVEIKERKTYLYTPWQWHGEPVWSIQLTKRWRPLDPARAGKLTDAIAAKVSSKPSCDVEIEIVNADFLCECSAEEIAFKLLWKVHSMIAALRHKSVDGEVVEAAVITPASAKAAAGGWQAP